MERYRTYAWTSLAIHRYCGLSFPPNRGGEAMSGGYLLYKPNTGVSGRGTSNVLGAVTWRTDFTHYRGISPIQSIITMKNGVILDEPGVSASPGELVDQSH